MQIVPLQPNLISRSAGFATAHHHQIVASLSGTRRLSAADLAGDHLQLSLCSALCGRAIDHRTQAQCRRHLPRRFAHGLSRRAATGAVLSFPEPGALAV